MAVVGFAEVQVGPTFTGFQSKVDKAANQLTSSLAKAGSEGGDKAGDEAAKEIKDSLAKAKGGFADASKAAGDAGGNAAKTFGNKVSGGLVGMAKKVAGPLAALFAIDKIKDFATGAYEEAREAQKVGGQTAAVIKSTGGAANVTAKQIGDLAGAISNKTGIDDEAIQTGQNMLLTFKNLKNGAGANNKIFDEATKIMTDMSVATGQDMKGAALQLGKALNDPAAGLSKLTRVGVTFTDQQKAQVKALQLGGDANAAVAMGLISDTKTYNNLLKQHKGDGVAVYKELTKGMTAAQKKQFDYYSEGGHDMEAQKVLLKELKTEFQGSAEAQATAGDRAKTAWANFQEEVGTKALPVLDAFMGLLADKVLPGLTTMADKVAAGVGWFIKWQPVIQPVAAGLGVVTAAVIAFNIQSKIAAAGGLIKFLTQLSIVTKAQAAVQWILNAAMTANPIGLVVVAIAALAAGLIVAYKKSETFRKIVDGVFSGMKTVVSGAVKFFTDNLIPLFTKKIPNAIGGAIGWVKKNWPIILAVITGPIGLAVLAVTKNWDKITGAFKKARDWVLGGFKKSWQGTAAVISTAVSKGKEGASKAWDGTKNAFSKAKDWVSGTWKKGWNGAKNWIGDAVAKGKDSASTSLTRTRENFGKLRDWGKGTFKKSWQGMKLIISDPVQAGKNIVANSKTAMQKTLNGLDSFGRKVFGDKWSGMKEKIAAPLRKGYEVLSSLFGKGGKGRSLFSGWLEAVKGIFGKLGNAIMAPIRSLITVINHGLIKGGINWILNKLKVPKDKQVPWIPAPKFAEGGWTGPGSKWKPAGIVHADEFVINKRARRQIERQNPGFLDNLNRTGAVDPRHSGGGYAGGGLVNFMGGRFTERFANVVMALSKIVPGFQMYQGGWNAGGVAASGGTHDRDAIDFGPANRQSETAARSLGMAAWLRNAATGWTQTGPHVHGVPGPTIGDGSSGARAQWQNYLDGLNGLRGNGPDTGTRQFVGKGGKGLVGTIGAALGGALDFLKGLSPIKWVANQAAKLVGGVPTGGVLGNALSYVPKFIVDKAGEFITSKIDSVAGLLGQWSGKTVGNWNKSQLDNAATIIGAAKQSGVGARGALVGLITAMQESTLNNISYGDRDSVGLFQQRAPWGSFSDRTNPSKAAWMFFNGGMGGQPGLKDKNGWQSMSPGAAAQAVQVSAYPSAYSKWIGDAQSILSAYKFDAGGSLKPGLSMVFNGTGKSETVRTAEQEAALWGQGRGEIVRIEVNVNGGVVDDRVAGAIDKGLNDYYRRRGAVRVPAVTR